MRLNLNKRNLPKMALVIFLISGMIMLLLRVFKGSPGKLVAMPRTIDELNSMPIVTQPLLVPSGPVSRLLESGNGGLVNNPAVDFVPAPVAVQVFGGGSGDGSPFTGNDYIEPGFYNPDREQKPVFIKQFGDGSVGAIG